MIPNSVISYFFLVWHDAILSPGWALGQEHEKERDHHTFSKNAALNADKGYYTPIFIVPSSTHQVSISKSKKCRSRPRRWTDDESKRKAFIGSSALATGGGILCTIASKTASTPFPVFAEIWIISDGSIPNVAWIWAAIRSGCAAGKSIYHSMSLSDFNPRTSCTLFNTGIILSPLSLALWKTDIDCAWTPWLASTWFGNEYIDKNKTAEVTYEEECTLTRRQGPWYFPCKVDVPLGEETHSETWTRQGRWKRVHRCINQIQQMVFSLELVYHAIPWYVESLDHFSHSHNLTLPSEPWLYHPVSGHTPRRPRDWPVIPRSLSTFSLSRTCSFFPPEVFFWIVPVNLTTGQFA